LEADATATRQSAGKKRGDQRLDRIGRYLAGPVVSSAAVLLAVVLAQPSVAEAAEQFAVATAEAGPANSVRVNGHTSSDELPVSAGVALTAVGRVRGGGVLALAADGSVYTLEGARFRGSLNGLLGDAEAVGIAPAAQGHGYWILADDGRVVALGRAKDHGDVAVPEGARAVGIAPTRSGGG
jgi:hypothetical protein